MNYKQFKTLNKCAFKRRCSVHPETFEQMTDVLRPNLDCRGKRGGQYELRVEDQLLLVLKKGAGISDSIPHCYERFRGE